VGIEIRPSGEAKASAAAGTTIGKAKARETAREEARRAQEMSFRQQQAQAAREWELQKMLMNSQQDFAHEMRMKQADLEGEARSKEWEIEKMELHSKFDFEQDEKERLRKKAMLSSGMETIDNSDAPDGEKDRARFQLKMKFLDVGGYEDVLGLERRTGDNELADVLKGILGETATPSESPPPEILQQDIPEIKPGYVLVKDAGGNYGQLPADKVEEAVAEGGYTLVNENQLFIDAAKKPSKRRYGTINTSAFSRSRNPSNLMR